MAPLLRPSLEGMAKPKAGVLEAIPWHGGEAEAAQQAVLKMKRADRQALVRFVESLWPASSGK